MSRLWRNWPEPLWLPFSSATASCLTQLREPHFDARLLYDIGVPAARASGSPFLVCKLSCLLKPTLVTEGSRSVISKLSDTHLTHP
ncbi:hypothetical protein BC834DRAFT_878557 [Gloeopeniophorella convolvens]|nr:hypothetical protein BC834DRAFT_878557 [Gloeopeniophorella convolvens]